MKQILGRFFYTGETGPGNGGTGVLPQMVQWNDLKEGAFSCLVPAEWNVQGGVTRMAPLDKRLEIVATSPDQKVLVRIGDAFVPSFSAPGPMMQFAGAAEGTCRVSRAGERDRAHQEEGAPEPRPQAA